MYITIIEDEKILSDKISKKLIRNWYNTKIYNWYYDFMKDKDNHSDLYIIDISLQDWNWFDIIKYLREEKKSISPIIITSGYSDPEKKIYWLDLWADDYITKPFTTEELIARIRALLRRSYKVSNNSIIKYKWIIYDSVKKIIHRGWLIIDLTSREIQFIEFMLFNKSKLVTKSELITSVWWESDLIKVSDNNINVTISNVRKKLWSKFKLKTIVWKWYVLE